MSFALNIIRNPISAFQTAMADAGIICPDIPIADGHIHRFHVEGDKKGTLNGWYVLYVDNLPGGAFGSWKTGQSKTWSIKPKESMTKDERQEWRLCMEQVNQEREKEQAKRHAAAKEKAKKKWQTATTEQINHPYLIAKKISPHGIKQLGTKLLVPLRDTEGELHSLQLIHSDGEKRFLTGGRVSGCYYGIGSIKDRLYVCEGFATGATIHEARGEAVAIAFDAGNLKSVSESLQKKYPDTEIFLCADDDKWTDGNPGITKAREAAQQVNGRVVVPQFKDESSRPTDFNDLQNLEGIDAVRSCLAGDGGDNGDTCNDSALQSSSRGGDAVGTAGDTDYVCDSRGVWYTDDEGQRHWICSPLRVIAQTRDRHSSAWGRLVELSDPDENVHRWACPMELLAGDGSEFRRILLSMGLQIAPSSLARKHLAIYVQIAKTTQRAKCVDRTGWHDNVFVLPDVTLGQSTETILLQTTAEPTRLQQAGTLEEWQANIGVLCKGNPRAVFAVSCPFAAVLLKIMGDESGGINFVGSSSIGKTTLLRIACSVMGAPDYLHRWRATSNGLEAIAQAHNDMLLVLDELGQVDAREAGNIAYMLANGSGKHRARRDGHAKQAATWRLLFLSAGEIGLADHMMEAGKRARTGQEVRMVDIPGDTESSNGVFNQLHAFDSGAALADQLNQSASKYYGTAGHAYIEQLTSNSHVQLRVSVGQLRDDFLLDVLEIGIDGQARRVAARFALIAAGGELATALQITGWEKGDAIYAARECFAAWLERRGGAGSREEEQALAQVRHFIELHGEARFSGFNSDRITSNRAGYRRIVDGQTEYLILAEVFRREVCAGFDFRLVARALRDRNFLVIEEPGRFTIKPREGGRVYAIRQGILDGNG